MTAFAMCLILSCQNERAKNPEQYLSRHRPGVQRIGDGVYRIGLVTVDANEKALSFDAEINMQEGLIEYLLCANWGKLHESVLVTGANPLDIQLGLLALGMKYEGGIKYQGDAAQGKGDPVCIIIEWNEDGHSRKARAEQFVFNQHQAKAMRETDWTFSGSAILEDGLAAQRYGLIVATYNDPYAVINNPLPSRSDDEILFANSDIVPPVGTPVRVIFKKAGG